MTTATTTEKDLKVVTEADLLKSIQDLTPKTEKVATTTEEPTVKAGILVKSAADIVKDKGSEGLKKALEVSDVLKEFAGLMISHADSTVEAMQKSFQNGAERDLAIIQVLQGLKKSIDDNTEALKKYGDQPTVAKTATTGSSSTTEGTPKTLPEVLTKSLVALEGDRKVSPAILKQQVTDGLTMLAKSFPAGDQRAMEYINAAVTFEATGKISDRMLAEAKQKIAPAKAA